MSFHCGVSIITIIAPIVFRRSQVAALTAIVNEPLNLRNGHVSSSGIVGKLHLGSVANQINHIIGSFCRLQPGTHGFGTAFTMVSPETDFLMGFIVPKCRELHRVHDHRFGSTIAVRKRDIEFAVSNEMDAGSPLRNGAADDTRVEECAGCAFACDLCVTDTQVLTIGVKTDHLHGMHDILRAAYLAFCLKGLVRHAESNQHRNLVCLWDVRNQYITAGRKAEGQTHYE